MLFNYLNGQSRLTIGEKLLTAFVPPLNNPVLPDLLPQEAVA